MWRNPSAAPCICSLFIAQSPSLCFKRQRKKEKSNSGFDGLDSFTNGEVCVTSELPLALSPTYPYASSVNSTLLDPNRSPSYRGVSRLWIHLWRLSLSLTNWPHSGLYHPTLEKQKVLDRFLFLCSLFPCGWPHAYSSLRGRFSQTLVDLLADGRVVVKCTTSSLIVFSHTAWAHLHIYAYR